MTHNNDFNNRLKAFEDDYLRSRNQMLQLGELLFKLLNMLENLEKRFKVLEEYVHSYPVENCVKHYESNCQHHEDEIFNGDTRIYI